jgi:hypothetical protein
LDAQKAAESVRKHYNEDAKYISTVERPLSTTIESENGKVRAQTQPDDRKRNMEIAQPYVGLSGGDALITIIFPTVGTVTLDLNDETNLDIAETILKKIKEKIKKRDANLTPPCFPPKEISEPNLTS